MRITTFNVSGSLVHAAQFVNEKDLAFNVLTLQEFQTPGMVFTTVVFRTEDYPAYTRLCEKLGMTPVTTKEYFK